MPNGTRHALDEYFYLNSFVLPCVAIHLSILETSIVTTSSGLLRKTGGLVSNESTFLVKTAFFQ